MVSFFQDPNGCLISVNGPIVESLVQESLTPTSSNNHISKQTSENFTSQLLTAIAINSFNTKKCLRLCLSSSAITSSGSSVFRNTRGSYQTTKHPPNQHLVAAKKPSH
ncbi:hypothetical protein SLA2020_527540 [Shorea laevis]